MRELNSWLNHRGHKVLLHDYSGLSGDDYVKMIRDRAAGIATGGNIEVKLLLDVTDSFVNKQVLATYKQAGVDIRPYVSRIAVVGLTGMQKYFLYLVNQFSNVGAKPFAHRDEALDWLTE